MNSSMIGKVEKAHRYTQERGRFAFSAFTVTVHGDNSEHQVTLREGAWHCSCEFFEHNSTCAHSMALELMLDGMLPQVAEPAAVA